jgi:hypothetical protein
MTNNSAAKQYAQKAILWITLASLIGVGSFAGLFRKFSGLPEGVVAEINGYDIKRDEYLVRIQEEERRIAFLKKQYGEAVADVLGSAEELALSSLTQEKLLSFAADELGIFIDDSFAAERVNDPRFALQFLSDFVPPYVFDKNGKLDKQGLIKVLQRRGISVSHFEELVEELLRRMLVGSLVTSAVYIPNLDHKELLTSESGIRDLEIIHFPEKAVINALKKQSPELENVEEKAREILVNLLKEFPMKSPEERTQRIAEYGAKVEFKKGVVGTKELTQLGKEAERVALLTVPGTIARIMVGSDGYLVTLKEIRTPAVDTQTREGREQSLLQQRMQGMPYEFIATLQKRATIKVNPSVLGNKRSRRQI